MPVPGHARPRLDGAPVNAAPERPRGRRQRSPFRRTLVVLAVVTAALGLSACTSDDDTSDATSSAASPTGSQPPAGWVAASSPAVSAEFPENWMRINDAKLAEGIAGRSPELTGGGHAVVSVRILDVGKGDAQQIGDSPATAAADQTLSQLKEAGVKDAKIVAGRPAGRPGWVITWTQVNSRDPAKRLYQYHWGAADLGTQQFVVVTAQAPPSAWETSSVPRILDNIRMPLAVSPTGTPTRTPDGSGDIIIGQQGAANG